MPSTHRAVTFLSSLIAGLYGRIREYVATFWVSVIAARESCLLTLLFSKRCSFQTREENSFRQIYLFRMDRQKFRNRPIISNRQIIWIRRSWCRSWWQLRWFSIRIDGSNISDGSKLLDDSEISNVPYETNRFDQTSFPHGFEMNTVLRTVIISLRDLMVRERAITKWTYPSW